MHELIQSLLKRQDTPHKRLDLVFYLRAYALRFLEEHDRETREDYSAVLDRQFRMTPDERSQFLDLILDDAEASSSLMATLDSLADSLIKEVRKAS
jgi:hypothetical protein